MKLKTPSLICIIWPWAFDIDLWDTNLHHVHLSNIIIHFNALRCSVSNIADLEEAYKLSTRINYLVPVLL